jgi:hypothetical protein
VLDPGPVLPAPLAGRGDAASSLVGIMTGPRLAGGASADRGWLDGRSCPVADGPERGDPGEAVGVWFDARLDAVDLPKHHLGQDVGGRTIGVRAALVQDHQAVDEAGGQVEIVEGDQDGHRSVGGERPDELEQLELPLKIEAAGRFVQEQDAWLAHERLRDGDHLTLAAAQLAEVAQGDRLEAELVQDRGDGGNVVVADDPGGVLLAGDEDRLEEVMAAVLAYSCGR